MKKSCKNCPKRNACTELCPEAEVYADQDHVTFHRSHFMLVNNEENISDDEQEDFTDMMANKRYNINLTPLAKSVIEFRNNGLSNNEIGKILGKTRMAVIMVQYRANQKNVIFRTIDKRVRFKLRKGITS